MPQFRKKPVVIEARQLQDSLESYGAIGDWCGGKFELTTAEDRKGLVPHLEIPTLEGVMRGSTGDWIIKGVNGEFYPCKPDIFEKTYEPVEES